MDAATEPGGRIVVTGANSGLGFETARILAARGAEVILAVRSTDRGWAAKQRILEQTPDARLHVLPLDLSSLASVREFAAEVSDRFPSWDSLVNNAAAILIPERRLTQDRFEWHFGVNHLGHFALTGLLAPFAAPAARVVTLYSLSARFGTIRFHDLRFDNRYAPLRAYAQSKLANLLFARELARKAEREELDLSSVAVHPGWVLHPDTPSRPLFGRAATRIAGTDEEAADAIIHALDRGAVPNGSLVGPSRVMQLRGAPEILGDPGIRHEAEIGRRLWRISGQLTRVPW